MSRKIAVLGTRNADRKAMVCDSKDASGKFHEVLRSVSGDHIISRIHSRRPHGAKTTGVAREEGGHSRAAVLGRAVSPLSKDVTLPSSMPRQPASEWVGRD